MKSTGSPSWRTAAFGGLFVALSLGSIFVSSRGGACVDQVGPALAGKGGPSGPGGVGPAGAGGALAGAVPAGPPVFTDTFERAEIGADWVSPGGGPYRIDAGVLRVRGAKNEALWLVRPLPDEVIVELDAWSTSPDGDMKVEIFGDGARHESGYSVIFGGWGNTITAITRLGEHEPARVEMKDSMTIGKHHRWRIVRIGGVIELHVDGVLRLSRTDPEMLRGPGYDRLAINNWASDAHYDNVSIWAARMAAPAPLPATAAPSSAAPGTTAEPAPIEAPGAPY